MPSSPFFYVNCGPSPPADRPTIDKSETLSLWAAPKTDIYAMPGGPGISETCLSTKEAHHYVYSAPALHRRIKRAAFVSATVTISATWRTQFDQGGLLLTLPTRTNPDPRADNSGGPETHPAWVKAGIETNDGAPRVSSVGRSCNGWAEWNLLPLPGSGGSSSSNGRLGEERAVTLELTRKKTSLLLWVIEEKGEGSGGDEKQRLFIRQVPWVFLDDEESKSRLGEDMLVGLYAAAPDPFGEAQGKDLEVRFSGLDIKTK